MEHMRRIILIVGWFVLFSGSQSEFCQGWNAGYPEGYCYQVQGCVAPPAPVCPLPEPGFEKYKDGYNAGFVRGRKDAMGK